MEPGGFIGGNPGGGPGGKPGGGPPNIPKWPMAVSASSRNGKREANIFWVFRFGNEFTNSKSQVAENG